MRLLVIPDVHLKPHVFDAADSVLAAGAADAAVMLGDLVDDWGCGQDVALYERTLARAARFVREHPDTHVCLGNHDYSYLFGMPESGYSDVAKDVAASGLRALADELPPDRQPRVAWLVDGVLFCHGGLSRLFAAMHSPDAGDAVATVEAVNACGPSELWDDVSPLWLRPQSVPDGLLAQAMYGHGRILQVVGHTPVTTVGRRGWVVSCDTFSTYRDGRPIGDGSLAVIDTLTQALSVR